MSKKFLVLFGILIFYVVFIMYSDFVQFSTNIIKFDYSFLPLIFGILFLSIFVKSLRQNLLLKEVNVKISLKTGILLYISGLSMIVTPGGSGELIKSYYLKKKFNHNISKTSPVVILERLFDLTSVAIILLISSIAIKNEIISIFSILLLLIISIIFIAIRKKKIFNFLINLIQKISFLHKRSDGVIESYSVLKNLIKIRIVSKALGLSVLAWSIDAAMIYFLFRGFNLDASIIFTTFSMYASLLLGVLSMIPAGIGVTEISFLEILKNEGIDGAVATSLIFLFRIVTIWFLTLLGFVCTKFFLK